MLVGFLLGNASKELYAEVSKEHIVSGQSIDRFYFFLFFDIFHILLAVSHNLLVIAHILLAALVMLLKDPSTEVRIKAAEAMSRLHNF